MASLADHTAGDPSGRAPFTQQAQPGSRLAGRYRLERMLRVYPGHFEPQAQSWIGFDELLNRKVGLEVIASDHPLASAVEAAARNAATVADVRFVQVLDVADEHGVVYVVKEWITDAADVATRLADGPLPVTKATKIAQELTRAVAAAHDYDLPHGALNPANVLVTSTGEVKVLGLCLEATLTDAPIGALAKEEDLRAVGCIWYAALTGRWPAESSAFGIPAAPSAHGRIFSPAQIRAAVPRPVDELVDSLVNPPDDYLSRIDSAKTLTGAIASLPRLREESDTTRVMPSAAPGPRGGRPPQASPPQQRTPQGSAAAGQGGGGYAPASHGAGPYGGGGGAAAASAGGRRMSGGVIAAIVAVVVAAGVVIAFTMNGNSGSHGSAGNPPSTSASSSASTAPTALTISSASIWDSDKGTDNAKDVADSYNGSTSGWPTTTYVQGPSTSPYRAGTGVIFDLGSVQNVSSVSFDVGVAGATTQVWTAPSDLTSLPPVSNQAPPGFTDQGTQTDVPAGQVTQKFKTVKTRYVMVWFISLPHQAQTQFDPAGYRDSLAEVKIYS